MTASIEDIKKLREAVNASGHALQESRKKYEQDILEMQKECPHPVEYLLEALSYDNGFGESYYGYSGIVSPFRVCTLCGWAEEGWGYWRLGRNEYNVRQTQAKGSAGHSEAQKFVLGKVYSQSDIYRMQYPERFNPDGTEKG